MVTSIGNRDVDSCGKRPLEWKTAISVRCKKGLPLKVIFHDLLGQPFLFYGYK